MFERRTVDVYEINFVPVRILYMDNRSVLLIPSVKLTNYKRADDAKR